MGTYLIGGLLALAVILAVRTIRKNIRSGGCAGGCSGCGGHNCHCHDPS